MKFGFEKRTMFVPQNLHSIDPEGHDVVFIKDRGFFQIKDGIAYSYDDENVGLVRWGERDFIKTNATSYVRDGNEYIVYLPTESLFITRLASAGDKQFAAFDFSEHGIWDRRFREQMSVFGRKETVSVSRDVTGAKLVTRANGEILELNGNELKPYNPDPQGLGGVIVRLDLEQEATPGAPALLTIFFRLRTTLGARLWLKHFKRTSDHCKRAGPFGSPFLRNWNVVFYAGEDDFRQAVGLLAETVTTINASYVSKRPGAPGGKLVVPTPDIVDSALLNELHFEFELFGDRLKQGDSAERAAIMGVYGPFCQLNDRVHACEGALANRFRTRDEAWWAIHCAFLPDFYEPLPHEAYREFTMDWGFGTLYMGYHTLGKDIIASFWNEDDALFDRDEIRPQRISSAEIYCFFGPDTSGQHDDLRRWWREKDIDRHGYTLDDPHNAIGYIPVGDVLRHGLSEKAFKAELNGAKTLAGVSLTNF